MEKKLNAKLTLWTAQLKKDIATHIIDNLGCSHEDDLANVVQYI